MRAQVYLRVWGGDIGAWPGRACACLCVGGGVGSFEPTQSLVLRHCIPAGWASCSRSILAPESPGRLLGIWPHILQIQGEIWQRFPPFTSLASHYRGRKPPDRPALQPSYLGSLGVGSDTACGVWCHTSCWASIKQFLPGPAFCFPVCIWGGGMEWGYCLGNRVRWGKPRGLMPSREVLGLKIKVFRVGRQFRH